MVQCPGDVFVADASNVITLSTSRGEGGSHSFVTKGLHLLLGTFLSLLKGVKFASIL